MAEPENAGGSFWRTLPGIVTAVAGLITAITGLLVAGAQIGILGGDGDAPPQERSAPVTASDPVPDGGHDELPDVRVTADRIAGSWVGRVSRGGGQDFVLRMTVAKGCARTQRCGSISVADVPCKGELFLDELNYGTYEFSVDNFTPASSASCRPGGGEYFTPQRNGTLRYRTGYDGSISGTLARAGR